MLPPIEYTWQSIAFVSITCLCCLAILILIFWLLSRVACFLKELGTHVLVAGLSVLAYHYLTQIDPSRWIRPEYWAALLQTVKQEPIVTIPEENTTGLVQSLFAWVKLR
jgi:hypothetical protein